MIYLTYAIRAIMLISLPFFGTMFYYMAKDMKEWK